MFSSRHFGPTSTHPSLHQTLQYSSPTDQNIIQNTKKTPTHLFSTNSSNTTLSIIPVGCICPISVPRVIIVESIFAFPNKGFHFSPHNTDALAWAFSPHSSRVLYQVSTYYKITRVLCHCWALTTTILATLAATPHNSHHHLSVLLHNTATTALPCTTIHNTTQYHSTLPETTAQAQ